MADHPLVVHVTDLLRRPGTRREVKRQVVLPDLALSTAQVADGSPVDVDVALEAQGAQVIVHGSVGVSWTGPCRRCLEPASGVLESAIDEVYERHATEGETWPLNGDHLDLEPIVREAVLLALPLAPLCRPECAGPDPERFPAAVAPDEDPDGPSSGADHEPPRDPRWAGLDALKFD